MSTLNYRIADLKQWAYSPNTDTARDFDNDGLPRDWSGSIADAWELVNELTANRWIVRVIIDSHSACVELRLPPTRGIVIAPTQPTAPEAICAAYLHVMKEKP
jgi:hypothetical protein